MFSTLFHEFWTTNFFGRRKPVECHKVTEHLSRFALSKTNGCTDSAEKYQDFALKKKTNNQKQKQNKNKNKTS